MPKKKPLRKKVPKAPRKGDEATAFRKGVIDFYTTEGNYQKSLTARHFKKDAARTYIYRIIKRYEDRRKEGNEEGWIRKKSSGRPRIFGEEAYRKYKELIEMDPNISCVEAGEILNASNKTIQKIKRSITNQKLNGTTSVTPSVFDVGMHNKVIKNGESGESIEDANDTTGNFSDAEPNEQLSQEFQTKPDVRKKRLKEKRLGKLKKTSSRRCVACFESDELSLENKNNSLANSLNVVYVLRNLLEIPSEQLVEMLRLSKGADPKDWVSFCRNCHKLVEECLDIQSKIKKLEAKLVECKDKISDSIRNTATAYSRVVCVRENLFVTRRVREIVRKQNPRESLQQKNPFAEGDEQAELLVASSTSESQSLTEVQVKQEVETFSDHSDLGEGEDADINEADTLCNVSSPMLHPSVSKPEQSIPDTSAEISGTLISPTEIAAPTTMPVIPENVHEAEIRTDEIQVTATTETIINSSTLGICDTCGVEMRPLAIPMHQLLKHDFVMEGYTAKYCSHEGCNYKTLYEVRFREHIRNHVDTACSYCGKRFQGRKNLLLHEQIHKNAESRPYVCEICGASFAVDQNLYQHRRIKHQGKRKKSNQRNYRNLTR